MCVPPPVPMLRLSNVVSSSILTHRVQIAFLWMNWANSTKPLPSVKMGLRRCLSRLNFPPTPVRAVLDLALWMNSGPEHRNNVSEAHMYKQRSNNTEETRISFE